MRSVSIKPSILLGVYGLIPVFFLLFILDVVFFNRFIRESLATDPNDYVLFTIIFTLPHIVASFFGFFDREYAHHYGKKILRGAQYAFVGIIVLSAINPQVMLLGFAMYTMTHVFLQQSGISKTLSKGIRSRGFVVWQWTGVAVSSLLYISIYTDISLPPAWISTAVVSFMCVFLVSAFTCVKQCNTRIGTQYFLLTTSLPVIVSIFVLFDYRIFALALPRMIHDITGYIFYSTHDHNRFAATQANALYKPIHTTTGLSPLMLSPMLSILIAYIMQFYTPIGSLVSVLVFIALLHYYLEGFIWKSDSMHRKYIRFAP